MTDTAEINETIFAKPSGNVRGIMTAFVTIKGKQKKVAHATLLVGSAADITLQVPTRLGIEDVLAVAGALQKFAAQLAQREAA